LTLNQTFGHASNEQLDFRSGLLCRDL
jgi:hypothetical protein